MHLDRLAADLLAEIAARPDLVQHALFADGPQSEAEVPAWADERMPDWGPLVEPAPMRDPALERKGVTAWSQARRRWARTSS